MTHTSLVSRASIILCILLTGGCATLSESECRSADWHDIGFRDGRNGRPQDYLNRHVQACGEHGFVPDRERYMQGRESGLDTYCTRHNGLQVGRDGGTYHNVCFTHGEREFLEGYSVGSALHRAHARLASVDYEISTVEATLKSEETSDKERKVARHRRHELEDERAAAQAEVDRLEREAQSLMAGDQR